MLTYSDISGISYPASIVFFSPATAAVNNSGSLLVSDPSSSKASLASYILNTNTC